MSKRIGIFSGGFDPVHKGHIAFVLQAAEAADLDVVYLAPEIKPRRKPHVTHIAHRVAMLELATRLHSNLEVLSLPDKYFLPRSTLPKIQQQFPDDTITLLMGSDLFEHMHRWPHVDFMLPHVGLVVGARGNYEVAAALAHAHQLPVQPKELQIIDSVERHTASRTIRELLQRGDTSEELLPSVQAYAKRHWLYHDIATAKRFKK